MKVYHSLSEVTHVSHPLALTIGNFDGVHLGHQKLLSKLLQLRGPTGTSAVITFEPHPQHFFYPEKPLQLLTSLDVRLDLLEQCGIDIVVVLPFDESIAELDYSSFLDQLRTYLPFDHLVLGKGASIGKNRAGTEEKITSYANTKNAQTHFIEKLVVEGTEVSSGTIRTLLADGEKEKAQTLLGRKL